MRGRGLLAVAAMAALGVTAKLAEGSAVAGAAGMPGAPACEAGAGDCFGTVEAWIGKVADGDTFTLSLRGVPRVRVWGLDAPERDTSAGEAATAAMRTIAKAGKGTCVDTGDRSYDRAVMQCFVGGEDVAALMIGSGHAREWCRFSNDYYGQCSDPEGRARRSGWRQ